MLLNVKGVKNLESSSATKAQQANAVILFGKRNAAKIVKAMEMYSKEKTLATEGIDVIMGALKTKDVEKLEKFAGTAVGKKLASAALKLANAKTPAALFTALKGVKAPAALKRMSEGGSSKVITPSSGTSDTKPKRKTTRKTRPVSAKKVDINNDSSVLEFADYIKDTYKLNYKGKSTGAISFYSFMGSRGTEFAGQEVFRLVDAPSRNKKYIMEKAGDVQQKREIKLTKTNADKFGKKYS